jgi:uncharacterized protein (DUF1800 family)
MDTRTAQALIRFGFGPRSGEAAPVNPEAWLLSQLRQPGASRVDPRPNSAEGLMAIRQHRALPLPREGSPLHLMKEQHLAAELANVLITPMPFRERLVWFWANHFTVSFRRGETVVLAGPFVEEAIRLHVTGRFSDMLLAVMRHPAMLMYLDNDVSIGPDSDLARVNQRGLNENLARECLELHTVSAASGYTQQDVTSLAKALTGWSVEIRGDPVGFVFRPRTHQPGPKTVLGQGFPPGEGGGVAALRFLSDHPSTYRFLASKLVRHFVADDPPPATVRRIEEVLRDTRGDLGAASAALVTLPEAWQPGTKFRTPQEFLIAAYRAFGLPDSQPQRLWGTMTLLGQPLWNAPAPIGWPDQAAAWATPEAMIRRIDWAYGIGSRACIGDPLALADGALGPFLRPATRQAIMGAESCRDALTLLLTSPEFQRR